MIQVNKESTQIRQQWNQYVDQNPHAIAWQAFEWADVVARHYRYEFIPLVAYQDDSANLNPTRPGQESNQSTIVGVLPLYLGPIGHPKELISVPFAVAGGILGDNDEARAALLNEAIRISEENGGLPIRLKQYKVRVPGELQTDETYYNRELWLQGDFQCLKRQVKQENLEKAEQSFKEGLEVEYPSQDIDSFYDLLLRYHTAEGLPCVSKEWIQTLIDFRLYSIALARVEGCLLAATMVKRFKKTFSLPFSCVWPNRKKAPYAVYGLYWHLINQFAAEGLEIFHSGRIPKGEKVPPFRLGWGGVAYPYYYQNYPKQNGTLQLEERGGFKRRLVTRVWKGLPLGLAKRLGPILVRQFP